MFRLILKQKLKYLSKFAIRKHKMEMVVVTGWYDTSIVKDLTYTLLHSKFTVRKMLNSPWWDFTVPLTILGYEDKKRSVLSWIFLLMRSNFRLTFGGSNPQSMILNLNYTKDDTAKYWSSFVTPDILIVTHFNKDLKILENLIKNTKKKSGWIVLNSQDLSLVEKIIGTYEKVFVFGEGEKGFEMPDLQYRVAEKNKLIVKHLDKEYEVQTQFIPMIKYESIAAALSVAIVKGISIMEALYSLLKFEMPLKLVKNVRGVLS